MNVFRSAAWLLTKSSTNQQPNYKAIRAYTRILANMEFSRSQTIGVEARFRGAQLLLSLYELRREPKMREARQWFLTSFRPKTAEDFPLICPPASEQETFFRMVYSYWEMAASFVTAGIVDEALFIHNNGEILQVWERISVLVPLWRELWNNPLIVKNMEEVAHKAVDYLDRADPKAYSTFRTKLG